MIIVRDTLETNKLREISIRVNHIDNAINNLKFTEIPENIYNEIFAINTFNTRIRQLAGLKFNILEFPGLNEIKNKLHENSICFIRDEIANIRFQYNNLANGICIVNSISKIDGTTNKVIECINSILFFLRY